MLLNTSYDEIFDGTANSFAETSYPEDECDIYIRKKRERAKSLVHYEIKSLIAEKFNVTVVDTKDKNETNLNDSQFNGEMTPVKFSRKRAKSLVPCEIKPLLSEQKNNNVIDTNNNENDLHDFTFDGEMTPVKYSSDVADELRQWQIRMGYSYIKRKSYSLDSPIDYSLKKEESGVHRTNKRIQCNLSETLFDLSTSCEKLHTDHDYSFSADNSFEFIYKDIFQTETHDSKLYEYDKYHYLTLVFPYIAKSNQEVSVPQYEVVEHLKDDTKDFYLIKRMSGEIGLIPRDFAVDLQALNLDPFSKTTTF